MMLQTAQSDSPGHGSTARPDPLGWRQEGMDLLRGIAAGSIAGMPLLFTMEMWWHGMLARPGHLLMLLGLTLVINAAISLFSGFRAEVSLFEAVSESITATGMGLVLSALILGLIGEIDFDSGLGESMGKIVIEAAPVSLGI